MRPSDEAISRDHACGREVTDGSSYDRSMNRPLERLGILASTLFFVAVFETHAQSPTLDDLGLADDRAIPIVGQLSPDPNASLTILVGGHLYGTPDKPSVHPAATFLDDIPGLRDSGAGLFVSLGDLYWSLRSGVDMTLRDLGRLRMPVFNTPGNHCKAGGDYEAKFGRGYGCVIAPRSLLVFLDTELDVWSVTGEQLAFFRRAVAAAEKDDRIRNVMFFGHRPLFASGQRRYGPFRRRINARSRKLVHSNYVRDLLPTVKRLAKTKHVKWFAGDIGTRPPNVFHDVDPKTKIHSYAVGLGNSPDDALLSLEIDADGSIREKVVSLTSRPAPALSERGLEYWKQAARIGKPATKPPHLPGPIRVTAPKAADGTNAALRFHVPITVLTTDEYFVRGRLLCPWGEPIAELVSAPTVVDAGTTPTLVLEAPADVLLAHGRSGPWMLTNLALGRVGQNKPLASLDGLAAQVSRKRIRSFSRPLLTGPTSTRRSKKFSVTLIAPFDRSRYLMAMTIGDADLSPAAIRRLATDKKRPLTDEAIFEHVVIAASWAKRMSGTVDMTGRASIALTIPDDPRFANRTLRLVGLVLAADAPNGIRSISEILRIRIE